MFMVCTDVAAGRVTRKFGKRRKDVFDREALRFHMISHVKQCLGLRQSLGRSQRRFAVLVLYRISPFKTHIVTG